MKNIEFRGKRIDNGEWLYGYYHTHLAKDGTTNNKIVIHHIYTTDYDKFVDGNTVGQYIGLNDVNGVKIFDGDVVEVTCKFKGKVEYENCGIVKYIGNAFVLDIFTSDEENETFPIYESICNDEREDTFIVIGNIYDDKDLLMK